MSAHRRDEEEKEELLQLSQGQLLTNHASTAGWRKRGEQLRASVIEQDESNEAQAFVLSSSCPIHRYYQVADKVLDQFLHHPIDTRDELLEAYMVGNRLVKFLLTILPTHGDYYTQEDVTAIEARERSQGQVSVVAKYLDQIALLIDKQEHEDYISSVLCQHQEEKSSKIASLSDQQREHMYYSDDTDDERNDNNKYLTTIPTGISDSTERLNNTSITSASNSVDSSNQTSHLLPKGKGFATSHNHHGTEYRGMPQDTSVVSDSVDFLLESPDVNSRTSLSEDPASTPSHTILRVSPTNEIKPENDAPYVSWKNAPVRMDQMPIVRSHWVANKPTKQNVNARALNSSVVSVVRSRDYTEGLNERTLLLASQRSPERSPGGSVRSKIRAWPPKQDPPGVNIDSGSMASSSSLVSVPSIAPQHPQVVEASPVSETQSMSDFQRRASELCKVSPFRGFVEPEPNVARHKWSDVSRAVSRREPSLGSSRVRFSSSSCSSSSQERSTTDDKNLPNESLYSYAEMNTSPEKEFSPVAVSAPVHAAARDVPTTGAVSKSPNEDFVKPKVLNFSPDNSELLKPNKLQFSPLDEPIVTNEAALRSKSPNAASKSQTSNYSVDYENSDRNIITPVSKANDSEALSFANFEFSPGFGSQQSTRKMMESTSADSESRDIVPFQSGRRGSGPVDLDISTTSTDVISETEEQDGRSTNSRGFLADGIDYVLPLPKSSSRKSSPVVASYAPSAADWSIDEPDMENQRFERQHSTISIDSTEFGTRSSKLQSLAASDKFRTMKFTDHSDHDLLPKTDWTSDWTRFDCGPLVQIDDSQTKSLDASDMSYKMTSMNDSMFSKATDVRRNGGAKGVRGGPSYADRTTSTGSSSSTPSKDPLQDFEVLSSKASQLLDPFSSRTPIEAPFLLNEEETPFMIDSKTEQRLRVSMKSTTDLISWSMNAPRLNISPNNIGLYGSLKEFQSLDCTVPFDDDATHMDDRDRGGARNGNLLLCRSRQKNWSDQRSPNEDDWEDSSLLISRNRNGQNFKSCVRCLLT